MLPFIEYSIKVSTYTYIFAICFIVSLAFARKRIINVIKDNKKLKCYLNVISCIDILIIAISCSIFLLYNSKTSVLALVSFICMIFVSECISNHKSLFYLICTVVSFGSIPLSYITHGRYSGLYSLSSIVNPILTVFIMAVICVSLILLFPKYESAYINRVYISAIFGILLCGLFNEYVVNIIYLIVLMLFMFLSHAKASNDDYLPFELAHVIKANINLIRARFLTIFIPIFMTVLSYVILGPLEIFSGNKNEFAFSYTDFFFTFLVFGLLLCVILSVIISTIPNEFLFKLITALILSFGLCSYIQNMFLNIKLHEEDGSYLNYNALKGFIITDSFIWCVLLTIIIILIVKLDNWKQLIFYSSGFICSIQIIAVVSLLITTKPGVGNNNFIFTGENELGIAQNNNIIILVLDSFGNKCLDKALIEYPDLLDELNDFTYYSNANADYQRTFPSMSHMLTGYEIEQGKASDSVYLNEAWTSDKCLSFYNDIHSSGYSFRLFSGDRASCFGNGENLLGKIDNVEISGSNINRPALYKLLLKTSAFKYVPYICKHSFETVTWEFDKATSSSKVAETDTDVYYQLLLNSGLYIDSSVENAITVKHLFALHDTDKVNANVERDANASLEDCAKGVMVTVYEYLNQLKSLGKYEGSTIIITADHGQGLFDYDNPKFVKENFDMQVVYFIKKANEHHPVLQVSNAPIRHCDLMPTIIYIIDNDLSLNDGSDSNTRYKKYGSTFFEHTESELRERFFFYKTGQEYQRYDYTGDRDALESVMEAGTFVPYKR